MEVSLLLFISSPLLSSLLLDYKCTILCMWSAAALCARLVSANSLWMLDHGAGWAKSHESPDVSFSCPQPRLSWTEALHFWVGTSSTEGLEVAVRLQCCAVSIGTWQAAHSRAAAAKDQLAYFFRAACLPDFDWLFCHRELSRRHLCMIWSCTQHGAPCNIAWTHTDSQQHVSCQ